MVNMQEDVASIGLDNSHDASPGGLCKSRCCVPRLGCRAETVVIRSARAEPGAVLYTPRIWGKVTVKHADHPRQPVAIYPLLYKVDKFTQSERDLFVISWMMT